MKFIEIFFVIFIIQMSSSARGNAVNNNIRLANRRQKKIIEGSLNLRKKPCNDFYEFACGKWDEVFLEAGDNYYEPITLLDYNANKELVEVFDKYSLYKKPKFIKEAYKYYTSCKNVPKYESIKYLIWLKANAKFRWPALTTIPNTKTEIQFDWLTTLAKMRTYGLNDVFIQQIVMQKINDPNKFVIDLDKPVIEGGFKPLTFVKLKVIMDSLPIKVKESTLESLWLEIKEFEQSLKQLDEIEDVQIEEEEDYIRQRLIYAKDLPFKWLKDYVKIILNQTELNPQMELYIQNIPYMNALDKLLQQYSQRFLCKYLEIRFLWHLHRGGPTNFYRVDCLANTRGLIPTALHWLYEQQHPELLAEYDSIYDIFNNVRKHFNNTIIANKHGFNKTVIQYLQTKLNSMQLRLNNIPRIDTINILEKFYENLNLHEEQFYENHLKLLRFNHQARLNLLGPSKPILDVTYLENEETGSSSSPFFVQSANTVFIPLTLLQLPIYSPGLDDIYKYSSLGFLLAHEMFHGFDDSGLLSNASGSMTLIQFEDNPLFNASYNCLLEINPTVISEKIADTSGLHYAYKAFFQTHPDAYTKTRRIYGHEIPLTKVFFLNFAQFFCGNTSPEEFDAMSDHGSDRDRVTDALANFPEFAKVFECSRNDRLYPHDSCRLWR
ncbi:neprilysin-2-like [Cochliomyia hominivorax]